MKRLPFLCLLGVVTLFSSAKADDSAKASALPDPVAVGDGFVIRPPELEATIGERLGRRGKKLADLTPAEKFQAAPIVLNDMIAQRLIDPLCSGIEVAPADIEARYQKIVGRSSQPQDLAERIKPADPAVKKLLDEIQRRIQEERWVRSQLFGQTEVYDEEAKAYFDSHPSDYMQSPKLVRASHILVAVPANATPEVVAEKRKAIDAAVARVKAGEDFAKVVSEVSDDGHSKAKGGDIGYFSTTTLPFEITDAAFAIQGDELSPVIRSNVGFHVIKVTERKAAVFKKFEDCKPKIVALLEKKKRLDAFAQLLKDLKEKAHVKISPIPKPADSASDSLSQTALSLSPR